MGIIGKWANEQIRSIHTDLAFIGTDGFDGLNGPATASYEEAEFKKNIVDISDKTIILSDSSKFHNRTLFEFVDWKRIDTLITDNKAPKDKIERLNPLLNIVIA